jgi:nucleotide-binding universal stress UspA family protein
MIRSVVVPLDGSRLAERAIPTASRIAQAAEATLHLVMAQDPTQGLAPFAEFGPPSVLLMEELDRRHGAYLERTAARLRKAGRIRVKVTYQDGAAGRVITKVAGSLRGGLVVMSTHGRGALGRFGLGSVADYVVRHVECPVLLIPGGPLPRSIPGRRILVPLDLSAESSRVLDPIADLAGLGLRPAITAIHVVEPMPMLALPTVPYPVGDDGELAQAQWTQAEQRLAEFQALGRRRGLKVSGRVVSGARAGATILDQLNQGGYDLIAMTTHGYSGFKRLLLGSVTNKVIRHATKPMLVVRPVGKRGRAARGGRTRSSAGK